MKSRFPAACLFVILGTTARAQRAVPQPPAAVPVNYMILCGTLIDGVSTRPVESALILLEGNKIKEVKANAFPKGFSPSPP